MIADFCSLRPSQSITRLAWRPLVSDAASNGEDEKQQHNEEMDLAVASEDNCLRLFCIDNILQN